MSDRRRPLDALVTDVHVRSAVAGLRALGHGGVRVGALGLSLASAGRWSRHAALRATGPDVLADPGGFRAAVSRLAAEHGPFVLYPGREYALGPLFHGGRVHPEARLPYPGPEPLARLRDKVELSKLALEAGLHAPDTLFAGKVADLSRVKLPMPALVKSAGGGRLQFAARLASDAELRRLTRLLPPKEPVIAQALVDGPLVAVGLVVGRDGSVVARIQQVAERTWPPNAGPSSLGVSVEPDEELIARIGAMLTGAGYWGLAQVQLLDSRDGPAVIDVNPRFYGSLPLALACGVNLPAAWHAVATGGSTPTPGPYRTGVTYRWLEAEITSALRGSWRLLFTRAPRPKVGAMWAADDPLVGVLLALGALGVRLKRRLPVRRPADA